MMMKTAMLSLVNAALVFFGTVVTRSHITAAESYAQQSLYTVSIEDISGKAISFEKYKGKVLLIVNVASACGYTPQYTELEALHKKYKDQGLEIIGVPANDFGAQEPGSNAQIAEFCSTKFSVTFTMLGKIVVKGENKHPLYTFLTSGQGKSELAGEVAWNFEKFLIGKDGSIVQRFRSRVKPLSEECVSAIEKALAAK
jgi:glutathione peroxidase